MRNKPMSEAERRRRLHQAYTILLDTARNKTAGGDVSEAQPPAAGDTPAKADAQPGV